jgi:hypothetical protein
MSDGFMVQPDEVSRVSQSFAAVQQVPANLGEVLLGVSMVQTGDPSLDGEIHGLVSRMQSVLAALTQRLTYTSRGLSQTAQSYRAMDGEISSRMSEIENGELTAPAAGTSGAVPMGIGQQLGP